MTYVFGLDLAQTLNYCSIAVLDVDARIKIATLRNLKNKRYPEIINILFDDLFPRYPPEKIVVDYTNERSVSETIEARLNPSFLSEGTSSYRQWEFVIPYNFTVESKLALKQNARELLERKIFVWPKRILTSPIMWPLVEEAKRQMMREAGTPGSDGRLHFPKPQGHDNDLAIALELALYAAKPLLTENTSRWWYFTPQDPNEGYRCNNCRNGNHTHRGELAFLFFEAGSAYCPCKICNPTP